MPDQKLEDLLNLSLEATARERKESLNLDVGYDSGTRLWDVIVKYSGSLDEVRGLGASAVPLLNGYAIVTIAQEQLVPLSQLSNVEYIEKPKRLFFAADRGRAASCVSAVWEDPLGLRGRGVLVGIVDSGVDYLHPDFQNYDGTTRILKLWEQTAEGTPPEGYLLGAEYDSAQIDRAIAAAHEGNRQDAYAIVPSRDVSGHGTQVLGIAAGNGASSGGQYRGMAPEAGILAVKLGTPRTDSFPRTTELMQGVDYLIRQSIRLNMPIAINLSFGNNYGSHEGDSLLTSYLNAAAAVGRTVICAGAGNNGSDALHASGTLAENSPAEIELSVGPYEPTLNLQLWKSYTDSFDLTITSPSGAKIGPLAERSGARRYYTGNTEILAYYGEPAPYSLDQEIYLDFLPESLYIDSGIWNLTLTPRRIVEGKFDLWLPGGGVLGSGTRFLRPSTDLTLTLPGTADKVITVGAYDARLQSYADFSGRGWVRRSGEVKPDLAAPGVNITATRAGGGYAQVTGTSFATPFVTGAAALLMEWGIVRGNDPYLFGEKVKAYLRRGARHLPGYSQWPNDMLGYGVLCVRESLPV